MLAQGRHVNVENVKAIIKITAYFTAGDGVLGDFVGRGEDAHVYWRFDFAAEAAQLVIFQDSKQFGLRSHWHFPNLIEQNRSALGELKAAGASLESAGEGALFMTEDLDFDQGLWNSGAIDGYEWTVAARAQFVDGARHELFACAAGASDEHRRGTGRDHFDQPEYLLHLSRCAVEPAQ